DRVEQGADLAVDDDRVEPLLAAEVLVDDGLAHLRRRGDLLDARALEALLGEQPAPDVQELLAPLLARHARPAPRPAARTTGRRGATTAARALGLRRHPPILSCAGVRRAWRPNGRRGASARRSPSP